MIFSLYAMRDKKTGFLAPTEDYNDDSAIRNFTHAVSQPNMLQFSFPEDYDLYRLGTFDTESGVFVNDQKFLVSAVSVLHKAGVEND